MSHPVHTYGTTCHLARSVTVPGSKDIDNIPELKAQFFYNSQNPIDDPLSAIPSPAGSESKSIKYPPRPFSASDNNALEKAWMGLASEKDRKNHNKNKNPKPSIKRSTSKSTSRDILVGRPDKTASDKGNIEPRKSSSGQNSSSPQQDSACSHCSQNDFPDRACKVCPKPSGIESSTSHPTCRCSGSSTSYICNPCKCSVECGDGDTPSDSTKRNTTREPTDKSSKSLKSQQSKKAKSAKGVDDINNGDSQTSLETGPAYLRRSSGDDHTSCGDLDHSRGASQVIPDCCSGLEKRHDLNQNDGSEPSNPDADFLRPENSKTGRKSRNLTTSDSRSVAEMQGGLQDPFRGDGVDGIYPKSKSKSPSPSRATLGDPSNLTGKGGEAGTTGLPFLKYSSPIASPQPPSSSHSTYHEDMNQIPMDDECDVCPEPESEDGTALDPLCKAHKNTKDFVDVLVGISRLHLVKLPALQMHPIYWSPVRDVASVSRATWFYKESMYPVDFATANQLEMGFRELRPWSQTWNDELNCALEVGAAGEEKISHRLWPQPGSKGHLRATSNSIVSGDSHCAARCFHGEAAAEGSIDSDDPKKISLPKSTIKNFLQSHVIYKDAQNAFILKPTLQPSAYYGRRPLQKIKRGINVGIPVVRGFDSRAWEKCHPSKKSKISAKVEDTWPISGDASSIDTSCPACKLQEKRPDVSDLLLVVHGIGQKLSERVEAYHFTHAINNFRRSINVELCNVGVQRVMRESFGGIMVLPVNWRSNLSFEEGGPTKDSKQDSASDFSLKDITPGTIPAVRNLISDVMLDIPFYMSHHKPKMIQAVITEANRIYRLWCKNNPEFHSKGRVHIIAHSLGSVMAVEVLSKQPTFVPKTDLLGKRINSKYFDFNTTNLFFCGSPAGFFLLLDKANLIPRRGQSKAGAEDSDDTDESITGKAGTFGCLAVDNLYNVMNYNDPIAYGLNATVDPQYSASLKPAQVPSAQPSLFGSIGNAMKALAPGVAAPVDLAVGQVTKPTGVVRLPSQLEMAIHNFTREEVAEKKFCLLNDNGQVDWFLSTNGGPLEIQYINMLGAHSSYWTSPDFIRMVVTECGRKPGRKSVLPNMKAVKIGHKSK